jgi:tetratricopeptide (TPR) repeat protein
MGDFEKAVYNYSKSLESEPDIDETHLNLITLYIEAGSLFMALITCKNYMQFNPESIEAQELMEDIILNLAISNY